MEQPKDKPDIGYHAGDKVDRIVGVKHINGVLHHYVTWYASKHLFPIPHSFLHVILIISSCLMTYFLRKGKDIATFVPAEISNRKNPHKVISFYESRIKVL